MYVDAPDKSSGKRKQKIHISYDLIGFIPVDVLTKAEQAEILREMRQAFTISDTEWGYEFRLRRQLTDIWLKLFQLARPAMRGKRSSTSGDEKVKSMMAHIHDHFRESISVDQLAEIVHVSKRVCFRLFQDHLHMTPVEYMRSYRLREACQMLAHVGASRRAPRKTPLI